MTPRTERQAGGPAVWTGAELARDPGWRVLLGSAERDGLLAGLAAVQGKGLHLPQVTADDFPLDAALQALAGRIRADVRDGRGFILLSGFPVEGRSLDEIRLMYWGLSQHLGTCISQDPRAALVADVMDRGQGRKKLTRGYGSKRFTPLHVDLGDVVGLLCIRQAAGGAATTLASSGTVYNAFLRDHPALLPQLEAGFRWDRFGEQSPWEPPVSPQAIPVFSWAGDQLSCRYNRTWMVSAFIREGRSLSNSETLLFDYFDKVAQENCLEVPLGPGEVYFANNYTVLHGRAEYDEDDEMSYFDKRHLLRIWIQMEGLRQIDDPRVRYGIGTHGHIGWTAGELMQRRHLDPGSRRAITG